MDDMMIRSVRDMKKYCERRYDEEVNKNIDITSIIYNRIDLSDEHARILSQLLEETRLRRVIYAGLLRAIERGVLYEEESIRKQMNEGELP